MGNHVIHVEVTGKDGPKLQTFYKDVFGWTFDTSNPGGYGWRAGATSPPASARRRTADRGSSRSTCTPTTPRASSPRPRPAAGG